MLDNLIFSIALSTHLGLSGDFANDPSTCTVSVTKQLHYRRVS